MQVVTCLPPVTSSLQCAWKCGLDAQLSVFACPSCWGPCYSALTLPAFCPKALGVCWDLPVHLHCRAHTCGFQCWVSPTPSLFCRWLPSSLSSRASLLPVCGPGCGWWPPSHPSPSPAVPCCFPTSLACHHSLLVLRSLHCPASQAPLFLLPVLTMATLAHQSLDLCSGVCLVSPIFLIAFGPVSQRYVTRIALSVVPQGLQGLPCIYSGTRQVFSDDCFLLKVVHIATAQVHRGKHVSSVTLES